MLSFLQAGVLGALQGVTELFPVSSLGHTVILPSLFGWQIDQTSEDFVAFVVLTHLATALVLLGFFWREWRDIIFGFFRTLLVRRITEGETYGRIAWLIGVSTIPAGLLGFVFHDWLEGLFAEPKIIAIVLALNGVILYAGEFLRKRAPEGSADDSVLAELSWASAVKIGVAQCFALVPGFSRTGATMVAGLRVGLSHENAVRFSFFMATPIIVAAAVLKVPHLFHVGGEVLTIALFGALCSGVAAYASVKFLTKYFETKTLTPFAIYCVVAGIIYFFLS
jgi:undecaprenyl-diphosphatase